MLTYHQPVTDKVQLGAEVEVDLRSRMSLATVGLQYTFRNDIIRGQIESHGTLAATLEHFIMPALTLSLTGMIDYYNGNNQFGFGVQFGGR